MLLSSQFLQFKQAEPAFEPYPRLPPLRRKSLLGALPLSLAGIHPARPFNRRRGNTRSPRRANSSKPSRPNRRANRPRGTRLVNILAYHLLRRRRLHNIYLRFLAKSQNLLLRATTHQHLCLIQNLQSTSHRYFLLWRQELFRCVYKYFESLHQKKSALCLSAQHKLFL